MDEQASHDTIHKLTWLINKHATIMQNSGAPVAMISSTLDIAQFQQLNYLGSFETDQLKDATSALTKFKSITE